MRCSTSSRSQCFAAILGLYMLLLVGKTVEARNKFTISESESKYFCGLNWDSCFKACRQGSSSDCAADLACGTPTHTDELLKIARSAGFSNHVDDILRAISEMRSKGSILNLGSSHGYNHCFTLLSLDTYETGIWIFKGTEYKISRLVILRLNQDENRIEHVWPRAEVDWTDQKNQREFFDLRMAAIMGIDYVTDDWTRILRIFENTEPVSIEGTTRPEIEKNLLKRGWTPLRPLFSPEGWIFQKPIRLNLWQEVCKQSDNFTCFGTENGKSGDELYRLFEQNRGVLVVRFDSANFVTGTWHYSAFAPYEISGNSRNLVLWTKTAGRTEELASSDLKDLGFQTWGEVSPSNPSYPHAFGAAAVHKSWHPSGQMKWWSPDGVFKFIKVIYGSGSFAVARYSKNGLDQVAHFRGLEGTVFFVPPQPPVIDHFSVTPQWQLLGHPLNIQVHSKSLVSMTTITVNGSSFSFSKKEPGVWELVVRPEWFANHIKISIENEAGTATSSSTVWYYPVILILGAFLAFAAILALLWHTRSQRVNEEENRQAAFQKRQAAFSEALSQVDYFLEEGFFEDADEFLGQLQQRYPEQHVAILQATQRVAMASHQAERDHLGKIATSLEDLASRIESPTGHLDLQSDRKNKGVDS